MNEENKPPRAKASPKTTENPYHSIPGKPQNETLENLIWKHELIVKIFMIFTVLMMLAIAARTFVYFSNNEANYSGGYIPGELGGIQLNNVIGFIFIPLLLSSIAILSLRKNMKKLYFFGSLNRVQRSALWLARINVLIGLLIFLYILWAITHFSFDGLAL